MNNRLAQKVLPQTWIYIGIGVLVLLLGVISYVAISENSRANRLTMSPVTTGNQPATDPTALLEEHGITALTSEQSSQSDATTEALTYLLEEEKLAHDVYVAMYNKWGMRIFNNIQNSESSHEGMVLAVMESRGLADPRKSSLGEFANARLQSLYDKLVAQGSQGKTEAYKVGVAIEELDIADLKDILTKLEPIDSDVKTVLENLLSGSENHLRAFNRQL